MPELSPEMEEAIRSLVDDYRDRCLWFLRREYYPRTPQEISRVMEVISRYGDQQAFRRARRIEQWLSRDFSGTSVES